MFIELRACAHNLGLRLKTIIYFSVKEVLLGFDQFPQADEYR